AKCLFFFSSRRRHTRSKRDWSSDVCSSDLMEADGQHLTSHILLSRGCPGEATCELVPGDIPADKPVFLARSGLDVTAAWSLYPMADNGAPHMEPIMAAIEEAKDAGLTVTSEHYATIVRGDLSNVLAVLVDAW